MNFFQNTCKPDGIDGKLMKATTPVSYTHLYRAIYKESREFLNIFAEPADSSASVTAVGVRGTSKVTVLGKVTGSGAAHRIAMYFDKTNSEAEAEVKVTVTTKSGKTTDYTIVVQLSLIHIYLPAEGFWKSKWGAGCFYFPWHCMWAAWLLNPEASVVCAAPSFCGSPSGGSGKNQPASRYQALSGRLRWNPVRIKLHDEK